MARLLYSSPQDQEANVDIRGDSFRLSRISHPRATLWAMILLALVFMGFGLIAEAHTTGTATTAPGSVDFKQWKSAWPALTALIPGR